ncbi:D-2-hydroxyacid dehydrogenase [Gordonia sp. zg691]|uniref:D-2-hydroxyacid dehydrogenase n=1 Tax=Gordonia jinghuaiqii TaxID=2758710 RepID=A0A7D7LQR1_9ACTN|nr:D-2-hydroxyacid dehydrogenase [Gordonia jinghuaiqii]MBD0863475.1 D-2-hydroxyacid dehydrogenase [Gordonia jinghuaiqii]MCR5979206.1 D-2-hydroxyacid dehydrogenase [Gordonia jinghuaiqii]QMT01000.1 D-2-hydroxyacid dehydrogenase [Gordonia jinghuaiqii]
MSPESPVIALLSAPDVAPPPNLAEIEELATVRHCTADDLGEVLPGADVLVLWDFFSRALRDNWGPATSSLRWVHVCAAGVDSLLFDELTASDVVVTNAHGVFDRPIAEFVLASIFARDKRLHESMALQRDHVWKHRETVATHRTSALVIGTGGIGRACAKMLRAVGISVVGAGRTARETDPDFGHVIATTELTGHIGDFDNVVTIAPLTAQTSGMIDARMLAAMKPGAHLINVGRGELVDDAALADSLRSGHLGAASLDVFATEPLPAESELWDLPGVAISAHMSGDAHGWRDALADQALENLRRYVAAGAEPLAEVLVNVVDKERGYISGGG